MTQLEEELLKLEERAGFRDDDQDEAYLSEKRRRQLLIKTLEELLSKSIGSYITTQGSLPIAIPRRSANSSQNPTSFNHHVKEFSCLTTTPVQEQQKFIPRSASQADINATAPFGKAVNPLDDHVTTDYKWYTSGKSYSGNSPTIIYHHLKPHYTGLTQSSMCV